MGGLLNNLLKKAELTEGLCAPGVVAEALELLAARSSETALSACLRVDPVLNLRLRLMTARRPLNDPGQQDLLRAMLLLAPVADGVFLATYAERWLMSAAVAYLAQNLARHSGLADPEDAWSAGLNHNLALYLHQDAASSADFAGLSATFLENLDEDGWLADAVRYHAEPLARGKMAHPLVRIVQLAYLLVMRQQAVDSLDVRAALAALGMAAADATHQLVESQSQARKLAQHYGLSVPPTLQTHGGGVLDRLARVYAGQAAQSALHHFFRYAAQPAESYALLCDCVRALFGFERVCLFIADRDGYLRLSPLMDEVGGLSQLELSRDDGHSILSRAFVQQVGLVFQPGDLSSPLVDEQIARRLGVSSFVCQPVTLEQGQAGLLVAGDALPSLPESAAWSMVLDEWAESLQRTSGPMIAAAPERIVIASDDIPRERVRRAIHEVANPLTIMRNYVNLLSSRLGSDSSVERDLGIISDEIERVARIVRGITAVEEAVSVPTNLEMVSVNSVVSELVRMTLGTLLIPNKVSVQIDLNPEVLPMPLNKDQLKQVLFNLAKNAVEAMQAGGHLKFTTRLVERDGANQVEIEVADTGPGLPEHVLAHLFEPVASQKGGDHAGLGLSISRNLVKQMGGDLDCVSTPQGSRFLVRLPTLQSSQAAPAAARHGAM
jgi:signal transduction histidine kinase